MSTSSIRYQRGQAMTELLVAMGVFLPLLLGTIYVAKYSDIKHQAIQASRYAALERALDPSSQHESDAVLTEETRARFFTDQSRNNGKVTYQDNTTGLQTNNSLNPLWSQMDGRTPMVSNYSDVAVNVSQGSFTGGSLSRVTDEAGRLYNLNSGGQITANVQVNTADITSFAPLSNLNLQIGVSTVVAGDDWNAGGASYVDNHFTVVAIPTSPLKSVLQRFSSLLDPLWQALSGTDGPQLGCVDADAVPADHLSDYQKPAPCSD
jgi:hypothetical protein